MPHYAILRFAKHKGAPARALEAHHERQKDKYASNPDIDTSWSQHNYHIIQPEGAYRNEVNSRIAVAGCRTRKDSTRFVDTLITASPEFFQGMDHAATKVFFKRATQFMCKKVGGENIISAVVHMDEKTPHLHLTFVPLTKDNRLSAKDILGNRASLSKWQDEFHAYMAKMFPGLERGESAIKTGRRHIPTRVYKQAVQLSKQAARIREVLEDINPVNAGKKKGEALAMLEKWFPDMEDFSTQLRRYKVGINTLEQQNAQLAKRVDASKASVKERMENAKLESKYAELKQFVDSIPDDIRRQLQDKQQQEHGRQR